MDNSETKILRANYNKHLKLHPCEAYLLMTLPTAQNMLITPENSTQTNTNVYRRAQEYCVAHVKWDLRCSKKGMKRCQENMKRIMLLV